MILSISLISIIVDETSGSCLYQAVWAGPTGHYLCNIARYKPDLASHGIEDLGYDGVAASVPEYVQEITIVPPPFRRFETSIVHS
jgi:hypothetical protein